MLRERNAIEMLPKSLTDGTDLILTDPPYELPTEEQRWIHEELVRIARRAVIVFADPRNPWEFGSDQQLFWRKPLSTKNTSRRYARFIEGIYLYELEDYVWDHSRHWSNYVNTFDDRLVVERRHKHQKPASLVRRLILNHTRLGDVVFDPFCGSGVVVREAERAGRQGLGWDLDLSVAEYYEEEFCGKKLHV